MKNTQNLKRTLLAVSLSSVSAIAVANTDANERNLQLEQRLDYLEQVVREQNKVIAGQQSANSVKDDESGNTPGIEFGAVVEVEAAYVNPDSGDSESDVVVATVELGAALNFTENLSGEIILLYEEDETDLEVDVAQVTYALNNSPISFTLGQIYVPFGAYETGLISDPLTLELGETRETVLSTNLESGGFSGSLYVFNGDVDEVGDNSIDNWGVSVGYGNDAFTVGASYINNLGDSDAIQEFIEEGEVDSYTDALSLNGLVNFGPVTLIAEYTTALDNFGPELGGAEPSATNLEANYGTTIFGKPATLALAYQTTDEALVLELPETRVLLGLGVDINDHFSVGIELSRDSDYDINEGGSGEDSDAAVVQFAASL